MWDGWLVGCLLFRSECVVYIERAVSAYASRRISHEYAIHPVSKLIISKCVRFFFQKKNCWITHSFTIWNVALRLCLFSFKRLPSSHIKVNAKNKYTQSKPLMHGGKFSDWKALLRNNALMTITGKKNKWWLHRINICIYIYECRKAQWKLNLLPENCHSLYFSDA